MFHKCQKVDVMKKSETGGIFICADPQIDQERMDHFIISPTGPMFGPKMTKATDFPGESEEEVLKKSGLKFDSFCKFPKLTRGTRRSLRLIIKDLSCRQDFQNFEISFFLPPGSYATSVLRELGKFEEVHK